MTIDALELLAIARKGRPTVEYRLDVKREAIAALVEGIWYRVAARTIIAPDDWVSMPYEVLVDGKRMPFEPDMTV